MNTQNLSRLELAEKSRNDQKEDTLDELYRLLNNAYVGYSRPSSTPEKKTYFFGKIAAYQDILYFLGESPADIAKRVGEPTHIQ